jgi:hypothetical protein
MRHLLLLLSLSGVLLASAANAEAVWGGRKFKVKKTNHKKEIKAGPLKYKKKF